MKCLCLIGAILSLLVAPAANARPNYFYRVSPANAPLTLEVVPQTAKLEYPVDARQRHFVGKGIFAIHIRSDGTAERVEVLKSTGHAILDEAAIAGLRQWHFRRGTIKIVRTPVEYQLGPLRLPKPGFGDLKNPGDGLQVTVHWKPALN